MMENLKRPAFRRLWKVLLFTGIIIAGLSAAFDFYYDLNDDTTIKDIISGTYTGSPSGYSIQMLYPLSFFISLFYRAIPEVPWYGLFLCACQFGAAALAAWRITGLVKKNWLQLAALAWEASLFLGFLIRQLVMVQYSVTSGICMATAIFLFITGKEAKSPTVYLKQNVIPIILVILSFMIRTELCVMLFPFLLLAGFAKWMAQEKIFTVNNAKRYFYVVGAALFGMAVMFAADKCSYAMAQAAEDWESFQRFFNARTDIYDFYGLPSYEANQQFYEEIGLARESYTLLENYNFSLDESIDEHLLETLVEFHKQHAGTEKGLSKTAGFISKKNLKEALWLYKEQLLGLKSGVYAYVLLAAYASYILLAGSRKRSGCYWKVSGLLVIRSILWLYLYMVDRYLERITVPLLLAELVVLLGWIVEETCRRQEDTRHQFAARLQAGGAYVLIGLCALTALFSNAERTRTEYADRERINSRWESLLSYCKEHEGDYYVVDVYSSTSYEGISYSEKIYKNVDNSYRNFDICGGWLAKSPLTQEKLMKSRIKDLESALYPEKKAYFIAACDRDVSWLAAYYDFKGQAVEPARVDTIYDGDTACFVVYQLQ